MGGLSKSAAAVHGGRDMKLKDYILRWQEVYDKDQSRPTTYAAHGYIFKNHILPGLGDIPLSELTVEHVGDFLEERRRFGGHRPESPEYPGLGEHTMRHIHRLLQQCLDQAMRDGLIAENPARAFHYPKPKKVSANVLTPAEVEDYLDAAERMGHLPMFLLALTAGLRQGELIALKWSDLDVKERTLTITEKRSVERRELVEYGDETRTISLTEEVVELLRLEHAWHPSSPLMFMHPATQKPYSPQMVRRLHDEIIREAGLDHIRFADLRHNCAVLSLQNGMSAKEVAHMQEAVKIIRDSENYRLTGLRTTLKEYIETECTDAVFKVGLSNLKYRTNGGNKPLRYLFSTLNEHIEWYRNGAVGAPAPQKGTVINYDNVTIEHIASQSPSTAVPGFTSENIHTLCNLTLLTNGENDRAKNKSYTAKKAIYHDSEYIINKYFDGVDDWNVENAKAWEQYLQEMVCKVFVV